MQQRYARSCRRLLQQWSGRKCANVYHSSESQSFKYIVGNSAAWWIPYFIAKKSPLPVTLITDYDPPLPPCSRAVAMQCARFDRCARSASMVGCSPAAGSGTVRERRQQQQQQQQQPSSADTQRLLTRPAGGGSGSNIAAAGGGGGDASSRSLGSSPLHDREGSSALLLGSNGSP